MCKHDLFSAEAGGERREGKMDAAVLATTYAAARWFAHFIHDELPLQLLAPTLGTPVIHRRQAYLHEAGWREALGVAKPAAFDVLCARELTVVRDFSQNRGKRERCLELRRRLAGRPKGASRVYLKRDNGVGMQRVLVNEDAVIARLEREGFVVVEPTKISVEELLAKCMGAETVVSVDGSHMSTVSLWMATGGRMLNLNPPWRVTIVETQIMWSFGVYGGVFVCDPGETEDRFSANPEEVVRAVEGMGKAEPAQEKARVMVG
jgi:hypothetical protein